MNKFTIVIFALLALAFEANALQCYECAPSKDCATNYSNKMKDCSKDPLSQGASYITSQKMVCARFGIGKYIISVASKTFFGGWTTLMMNFLKC